MTRSTKLLNFMQASAWNKYITGVALVFVLLVFGYICLVAMRGVPKLIDEARPSDNFFVYNSLTPITTVVGEPLLFESNVTVYREGVFSFDDTLHCSQGDTVFLNYKSTTPTVKKVNSATQWSFFITKLDGTSTAYTPQRTASCELRSRISLELANGAEKSSFILTKFTVDEVL